MAGGSRSVGLRSDVSLISDFLRPCLEIFDRGLFLANNVNNCFDADAVGSARPGAYEIAVTLTTTPCDAQGVTSPVFGAYAREGR